MQYSKANPRRGARIKKKLETENETPSKTLLATRSSAGTKEIKEEFCFVSLNLISSCRICLQSGDEGEDMASIFDQDEDAVCLFEKIESCGGIKLLTDPELPTRICAKCSGFLAIAHKFRLTCRNSDNYLREFVCKYTSNQTNGDERCDDTTEGLNSESSNVATVGQELQQENNNVDETQHSIECEKVAVVWMDEDDNPVDLFAEDHDNGSHLTQPPSKTKQKRQKKQPAKQKKTEKNTERKKGENPKGGKSTKKKNWEKTKAGKNTEKKKGEKTNGAAVMHSTNKTGVKDTHICHMCGNKYPIKYLLDAHMKRHRYEREFVCEICSQAFHLNGQLVRHMRKHTGERPFPCQYCERAFTDISTRRRHERVHRNERPFVCDTCGKNFSYSYILKRHKLTHTGEKPFSCGICGKCFAFDYHLRAHLETLQHQSDPRTKLLLKKLKREGDMGEDDGDEEQNLKEANE